MANLALKSLTGVAAVAAATSDFVTQTFSSTDLLAGHYAQDSAGPGSATWPLANLAVFVPFRLEATVAGIIRLWASTGGAVSGNVDVGVYDSTGVKLFSTGSTAQTATFTTVTISSQSLAAGLYYIAMSMDNVVGTTIRQAGSIAGKLQMIGLAEQTAAFPLPATATLASATNNYFPTIGWATWAFI